MVWANEPLHIDSSSVKQYYSIKQRCHQEQKQNMVYQSELYWIVQFHSHDQFVYKWKWFFDFCGRGIKIRHQAHAKTMCLTAFLINLSKQHSHMNSKMFLAIYWLCLMEVKANTHTRLMLQFNNNNKITLQKAHTLKNVQRNVIFIIIYLFLKKPIDRSQLYIFILSK